MIKVMIYSHGFGVKADARGMFTEIAASFPEYKSVMFDYNEVLPNGDTIVAPIDKQALKLQNAIDEVDADEVVLLCHSQGCLIAGLVDLSTVSKVILLAPPVVASMQHVIQKLSKKPGSEYLEGGVSRLARSDGSMTFLPNEYMRSLDEINPIELYKKIADQKPAAIIRATRDEVLGLTDLSAVAAKQMVDIAADHDFTSEGRQALINTLKGLL